MSSMSTSGCEQPLTDRGQRGIDRIEPRELLLG
jgi:hypothetical protein